MAARPIWAGTLSFGLLNVPVSLMPGERKNDLHFRMLDARNNAAVKYERVNAEQVRSALAEAGFTDVVVMDEYTLVPASASTMRATWIARRGRPGAAAT